MVDFSNDYLKFDNLVTVTYYTLQSEGIWTTHPATINNCKFHSFAKNFVGQPDADLRNFDSGLTIWQNESPTLNCKRGDKVIVNAQTYIVDVVAFDTFVKAFRLKLLLT